MAVVAIVGRPNVGKSTLFNRLCRKRHALVDDLPGVTRDRLSASIEYGNRRFLLMDTGGFTDPDAGTFAEETRRQVLLALEEADAVIFLADARTGLHPGDQELVGLLRKSQKPVFYAVNKVDGREQEKHIAEFYALGVEKIYPLSAAHGLGVYDLMDDVTASLPPAWEDDAQDENPEIRVAVVGRPNTGKSTLVNALLGEERVIVSPVPGTTRDAVDTPVEVQGRRFLLIDTAGIRRKGRTRQKLEKISVIKALESIDRSHVVILMVDALEGVTDQDLHIGGYVQERGRGCLIAVNKWDAMPKEPRTVRRFLEDVRERFRFLPHAPIVTMSALQKKRVSRVFPMVWEIFDQFNKRVTTGMVNRVLVNVTAKHEPPLVSGRRLKFYYATQASTRPPTFVLFCNEPQKIHFSYERFLTNQFREAFGMDKTPVRLVFRERSRRNDESR
ncbi:ribosome biogenesis GTPase Der [Desulfosoma caldarium]|uniref:GTPase Der n=1 Tax=Desulfosoma caldarium TaxID=610254 RepID=A0A3N1UTR8_9BACT|nr:ribosome biogenesis GTPase Der [Desulfosoma caldarium]ROQ93543.1 GTP-binding protein [Desulfosoma caldarium]